MKIPNQQKVWDNISAPWSKFRVKPIEDVVNFLAKQKGNILDLGCGSGRNFLKSEKIQIYAIDFSKKMVKLAKDYAKEAKIKAKLFVSDLTNLPFDDNFFDAAIFIATLHCIEEAKTREKTLKELYRTLKPGAQALIMVWSRNQKRLKNKPKECYIPWTTPKGKVQRYTYIYDKSELEKLLEKVGFKALKSKENKNIILIVKKPNLYF